MPHAGSATGVARLEMMKLAYINISNYILKVNIKFFNIYSSNIINFKYNYRFLNVGGAYGSR